MAWLSSGQQSGLPWWEFWISFCSHVFLLRVFFWKQPGHRKNWLPSGSTYFNIELAGLAVAFLTMHILQWNARGQYETYFRLNMIVIVPNWRLLLFVYVLESRNNHDCHSQRDFSGRFNGYRIKNINKREVPSVFHGKCLPAFQSGGSCWRFRFAHCGKAAFPQERLLWIPCAVRTAPYRGSAGDM